jgi:hypothetical protein
MVYNTSNSEITHTPFQITTSGDLSLQTKTLWGTVNAASNTITSSKFIQPLAVGNGYYGNIVGSNTISGSSLTLAGTITGATSISATSLALGGAITGATSITGTSLALGTGAVTCGIITSSSTYSAMTTTTGRILTATATGAFQTSVNAPYIEGTTYNLNLNTNTILGAAGITTTGVTTSGSLVLSGSISGATSVGCTSVASSGTISGTTISASVAMDPNAIIDNTGTAKGNAYEVLTASSSGSSLSWQLPTFPIVSQTLTAVNLAAAQTLSVSTFFPASTVFESYRVTLRITSWPDATTNPNKWLLMSYSSLADTGWTSFLNAYGNNPYYPGTVGGCVIAYHNNGSSANMYPLEIDLYIINPYAASRKTVKGFGAGYWNNGTLTDPTLTAYTLAGFKAAVLTQLRGLYLSSTAGFPGGSFEVYPWS